MATVRIPGRVAKAAPAKKPPAKSLGSVLGKALKAAAKKTPIRGK